MMLTPQIAEELQCQKGRYLHIMVSLISFLVVAAAVLCEGQNISGDDSTSFLQQGVQARHINRKKELGCDG
eukprot:s106_g5.t1